MLQPTIIPAILSDKVEDYTKFANLYGTFTDKIHLDVMDGEFVVSKSPNIFDILNSIPTNHTKKSLHLMMKNPVNTLSILGETKSHIFLVYIHVETIDEDTYDRLLSLEFPFKLGFVFDPRTNLRKYADLLTRTKIVQIMTVNPGVQGAEFIPETLENIRILREEYNYKGEIHIDGHVNAVTLPQMLIQGPSVLNVGSAIQKSENPEYAFLELKQMLSES